MIEAILKRRSVRTYLKEPLTSHELNIIQDILDRSSSRRGIFGFQVRFFFLNHLSSFDDEAKRIGTYGFVKNAPAFIGGVIENKFNAIVDFGYLFEHIILEATEHDFGTVWLGGTFDRNAFKSEVNSGEVIPAISPVGYSEDHMSFREKSIRLFVHANQRKSYKELFFEENIETPILDQNNSKNSLVKYLEFVQAGPSASNKQPWRIVLNQNKAHFYLKRTENYGTSLPFDIQALDMGIALCHFEEGLKSDQRNYTFENDPSASIIPGLVYIITVVVAI